MEQAVYDAFLELKAYKRVAKKLKVDPKTVSRVVKSRQSKDNATGDSRSGALQVARRDKGIQGAANSNRPPITFSQYIKERDAGASLKQIIVKHDLIFEEGKTFELDYHQVNGLNRLIDFYNKNKHRLLRIENFMGRAERAGVNIKQILDYEININAQEQRLHAISLEVKEGLFRKNALEIGTSKVQDEYDKNLAINKDLLRRNNELKQENTSLIAKNTALSNECESIKTNREYLVDSLMQDFEKEYRRVYANDSVLAHALEIVLHAIRYKPGLITEIIFQQGPAKGLDELAKLMLEWYAAEMRETKDEYAKKAAEKMSKDYDLAKRDPAIAEPIETG